jgi:hypothetical protein
MKSLSRAVTDCPGFAQAGHLRAAMASKKSKKIQLI